MQYELPKAKEERGRWNSEGGGLGGGLEREEKEVGRQGMGGVGGRNGITGLWSLEARLCVLLVCVPQH